MDGKNYPKLEDMMAGVKSERPRQTWQQQLAILKTFTAAEAAKERAAERKKAKAAAGAKP